MGACIREACCGLEEEKAFMEEVTFKLKSERQVGDW